METTTTTKTTRTTNKRIVKGKALRSKLVTEINIKSIEEKERKKKFEKEEKKRKKVEHEKSLLILRPIEMKRKIRKNDPIIEGQEIPSWVQDASSIKTVATLKPELNTDTMVMYRLAGNRIVSESEIKEKLASFRKKKNPIIDVFINEYFQIIDGQHRLLAAQRGGYRIRITVLFGNTLLDVIELNKRQRNWLPMQYVDSFCERDSLGEEGFKDFPSFRTFYYDNRPFSISTCLSLCTQVPVDGGKEATKLKEGILDIKDIDKAYKLASEIKSMCEFYDGWTSRPFVMAMIKCLLKPKFSLARFKKKIVKAANATIAADRKYIQNRSTTKGMLLDFQEIYNFGVSNDDNKMFLA